MKKSCFIYFVGFALTFLPAVSNADKGIEGLWLTENERAAVEINRCKDGASLCGNIAWIIEGGMQMDENNPDAALRNRPLCDMEILYGFEKGKTPGEWVDGKIYKADDGDVYNASIKQIGEDRLRLRGYIGIPLFGKTQIWTRVSEDDYKPCDK